MDKQWPSPQGADFFENTPQALGFVNSPVAYSPEQVMRGTPGHMEFVDGLLRYPAVPMTMAATGREECEAYLADAQRRVSEARRLGGASVAHVAHNIAAQYDGDDSVPENMIAKRGCLLAAARRLFYTAYGAEHLADATALTASERRYRGVVECDWKKFSSVDASRGGSSRRAAA
ncbi:hypothetical protein CR970_00365 [Candidatus Saccharibacteria bacterium]|nr:MAG: hypothetical protein CR970_00365 [Candidatus Saccharibacteria bacterium]